MATVDYALQVTLLDDSGGPIIRCWGPVFRVVDGVASSPGFHHFIISFDTSVPRVQMAMDRGGGPVLGGSVMDTANGSGVIDASGGFPDQGSFVHGQMYAKLVGTSLNGFATHAGIVNVGASEGEEWEFNADSHTNTDFAYCYLGVSNTFFDLTNAANLNFFVTAGLAPVDLGAGGENVTPLQGRFMHTGNALPIIGVVPDPWNSTFSYQAGDYVTTFDSATRYWVALSPVSIAGSNIDRSPDQFGFSLEQQLGKGTLTPFEFWLEVSPPLIGPEFCWNGITGVLAQHAGSITSIPGP
jgi:hypothetical protein